MTAIRPQSNPARSPRSTRRPLRSRSPMRAIPGARQDRWQAEHARIKRVLLKLRKDIDNLGAEGELLVFDNADPVWRDPDVIGCYASNSIEGTLSLLEELYQRVVSNGDQSR